MPNSISREAFIRAWSSGDSDEQGGMLYDLVHCMQDTADDATKKADKTQRQMKYIWGGIGALAVIATPTMMYLLYLIP